MNYLAIDLGAESGRVIFGALQAGRIALEELHRFPNVPIRSSDSIQWNTNDILSEVLKGISKAAGREIASVSADSWGVDYILIGAPGPVYHYRDPRTARGAKEFLAKVSWETIFEETGIQYMPINTLFQLASEDPERLKQTRQILSIADYANCIIGGRACLEESMASTYQLYDPRKRDWSPLLLEKLGIPRALLGDVVPSGTKIGELRASITRPFFGGAPISVIATCSHDTGAAVAAVPAKSGSNWAYLSSGTWSLMGVERKEPIINDTARELNFTNEVGYGGSIRLLKNISGLWLLQECRRIWAEKGPFDYGELTKMAAQEPAFRSIINPADERFLAPPDMPRAIVDFCRETNQPPPETPGAFTRCIFESLALLYRKTLLQIQRLTGTKIDVLHIVGGGSKNALLNQFTADACQVEVLAGPVEATALGNIMIQAITMGEVPDLAAARSIIAKTFDLTRYEPKPGEVWMAAFERFQKF